MVQSRYWYITNTVQVQYLYLLYSYCNSTCGDRTRTYCTSTVLSTWQTYAVLLSTVYLYCTSSTLLVYTVIVVHTCKVTVQVDYRYPVQYSVLVQYKSIARDCMLSTILWPIFYRYGMWLLMRHAGHAGGHHILYIRISHRITCPS
mgnify:CR=1 FL=1